MADDEAELVCTWATGSGHDDGPLDWLFDLRYKKDVEHLRGALDAAKEGSVGEGQTALLACECVAFLIGAPADLHEDAQRWLEKGGVEADPALVKLALGTIDRIAAGSQLSEWWDQHGADRAPAWRASVADLRRRLASPPPADPPDAAPGEEAAPIRFATPQGLRVEEQSDETLSIYRFRHPKARMELSLLAGPWNDLAGAATQTAVRYVPPEGRAMTDQDRETLGRAFVGAIEADLAASLAQEKEKPPQVTHDEKGRTPQGHVFVSRFLASGSVTEGTTVVFHPDSLWAGIVAFRTAAAHLDDVKKWHDAVVQSIEF